MIFQISKEEVIKHLVKHDYKSIKSTSLIDSITSDINLGNYDFSLAKYYNYKNRRLATFNKSPKELVLLNSISSKVNKVFSLVYPNRNAIMRELVNNLLVIKQMEDFSIIRFDFEKYFPSISTSYIYEHYIKNSDLNRGVKDVIYKYTASNHFCTPGISLSNTFSELIASDFDNLLNKKLSKYGILFYSRYVDDGIIILNQFINKDNVLKVLNDTIDEIYHRKTIGVQNKTKLNLKKFEVINKRKMDSINEFSFLGYKFKLDFEGGMIIGITQEKMVKFKNKIEKLVFNYQKSPVMLRHILKANSSRIVYCTSNRENRKFWITKGLIANYAELRRFYDLIDVETSKFLKSIYFKAFTNQKMKPPHYLFSKRYNLYENLMKNRTLVFDQKIGHSKQKISNDLIDIGITPNPSHDYIQLARNYLINVKIGH